MGTTRGGPSGRGRRGGGGAWRASGVLLALLATPAAGEVFRGTTSTVLVEVPVEVTVGGEPVRGLTADDFEVYDGRRRQPITSFEVVDLDAVPARATAEVPVAARRHFLLLFDLSFTSPAAVERARLAARRVVEERLHPADLVAVATYSAAHGPRLVLAFTPDRHQLSQALETLGLAEPRGSRRDPLQLSLGGAADAAESAGVGGGSDGGSGRAAAALAEHLRDLGRAFDRLDVDAQRQQLLVMARSMGDLAAMMRRLDGRKHVVFFSAGFDPALLLGATDERRREELNLATQRGELWQVDSEEHFGSARSWGALTDLVEGFRQAGCTLHAVDVGGLRAGTDPARSGGRDGLFYLAQGTGGELYEGFNDLGEAMGRLLERTRVTYLLAFQPRELAADGRYHRLAVKLRRAPKGARVVHRPGYFAPDPEGGESATELSLLTAQELLAGREGGAIAAGLLATPLPAAAGAGKAEVPVLLEVEGESFLAGVEGAVVPVELYLYAIGADGGIADFLTQTVQLDLERAGAALGERGFKLYAPLRLPPGDYALRALVLNRATGRHALRIAAVSVPALAGSTLLPPLFPERPDAWLLLRAAQGTAAGTAPYPFLYQDHLFVPAARPRVHAGERAPVFLFASGFGEAFPAAEAQWLDAVEQAPAPRLALAGHAATSEDGLERFLGVVEVPAGVPAGEHTLLVTLHDPQGGERSASLPLEVVPPEAAASLLLGFRMPEGWSFPTPPEVPLQRAAEVPPAEGGLEPAGDLDELAVAYRRVLRRREGRTALVRSAARLEVAAAGTEDAPRRLERLRRTELAVAEGLAARDLEALVPVIQLHIDLYREHLAARSFSLIPHTIDMVVALAALYADRGGSAGTRVVAARALASLGGFLQESGRSATAASLLRRALDLDPGNESALLGLAAYCEKKGGPYERAVAYLERLVAAHPASREGRLRLAINQLRLGRTRDAADLLRALVSGAETDWIYSLAAQELARLEAREGELAAALGTLRAALGRAPGDQKLQIELAYLLERNRQPYEAQGIAERLSRDVAAGEASRGRYNQWPRQALAETRRELDAGAESRQPLLAAVLGEARQEEEPR